MDFGEVQRLDLTTQQIKPRQVQPEVSSVRANIVLSIHYTHCVAHSLYYDIVLNTSEGSAVCSPLSFHVSK